MVFSAQQMLSILLQIVSMLSRWCTVPAIGLTVCIITVVWRVTFHPLARFPGPKLWAMTRLPWHVNLHRGKIHHAMLAHHLRYGPIVRIAPDELSIVQADGWRDVYGNKDFERNSVWFKRSKHALQGEAITTFKEDDHARLRRAFMGAFSEAGVADMAPTVENYVSLLVAKLKEHIHKANGETIVDLVSWLNFTTFDLVGHFAFGEPFNCLADGEAHPWVALNLGFGRGVALGTSMGFLAPLDKLFDFIIPKDIREKFAYHQTLTREKVTARLAMQGEREDYLGSALRHNQRMTEKDDLSKIITRDEMDQNMGIFTFAGSETSASALSATFRYVLQAPDVLESLRAELYNAFTSEDQIRIANCGKLEYVTAVLNESMRLGPPSVIGVPRYARFGTYVCGQWIPKGTLVSVNQFAAYRSPFNFTDPDSFRPDRFLTQTKQDNMEVFQPFAQGRHQCIGYRMAWNVMRLILTRLVYAFDMEIADQGPVKDYGAQDATLFWEKEPLMVRLRDRKPTTSTDGEIGR